MANPKVIRPCRQCGVTREHYTRRNGRVISPCAECQIQKAKARQDSIRDDPVKLERQRAEWTRIKKRQRMIDRGEVGTHTGEPVVPPGVPMVERRRRRRRRREQQQAEEGGTPDPEPAPVNTLTPSRRRRRPLGA